MKLNALCVGINDYPGTNNDLNGCVNDADDWATELTRRGFATLSLVNSKATKLAITHELKLLLTNAQPRDVVVFTYSGHGTWTPDVDGDEVDGRDEALCPYDFQRNLITDDELYTIFTDRDPQVRLVFISDSCHSGTVARMAPTDALGVSVHPSKVRFMPPAAHIVDTKILEKAVQVENTTTKGRARTSALLMSGCQDTEYSYDAYFAGRPNGAFTQAALKSLKSATPATYNDWFKSVRTLLPSQSYPQKPNLSATAAQRQWKVFG